MMTAPKTSYGALKTLGIFLVPRFLDPDSCAWLRREIDAAPSKPTSAYSYASDIQGPDTTFSVCRDHVLTGPALEYLRAAFLNLMPRLEGNFRVKLALKEPLGIRTFGPGGFIAPHTDLSGFDSPSNKLQLPGQRKVSAILYLSTEAEQPSNGFHCGGPLVFYGLIPGSKTQSLGFPLSAEAGLLAAFRADVGHEVLPVLAGTRYTVTAFISSAASDV